MKEFSVEEYQGWVAFNEDESKAIKRTWFGSHSSTTLTADKDITIFQDQKDAEEAVQRYKDSHKIQINFHIRYVVVDFITKIS